MSSKIQQLSITTIGLDQYLTDTRSAHNYQGYEEFEFYLKYAVPVTAIGRMFFVNRKTVIKWRAIYKQEQEAK